MNDEMTKDDPRQTVCILTQILVGISCDLFILKMQTCSYNNNGEYMFSWWTRLKSNQSN